MQIAGLKIAVNYDLFMQTGLESKAILLCHTFNFLRVLGLRVTIL